MPHAPTTEHFLPLLYLPDTQLWGLLWLWRFGGGNGAGLGALASRCYLEEVRMGDNGN